MVNLRTREYISLHRFFLKVVDFLSFGVVSYTSFLSETYSCLLRLRSSPEEDAVCMQPGSGEAYFLSVLFPFLFLLCLLFSLYLVCEGL